MKDFLNTIALCLLAGIGLVSFAQGQAIRVVNPADLSAYPSITTAVFGAPAGTIIEIVGLTDPVTGQPLGYSDDPLTTQVSEVFPISVPSGVTLRRSGSTPVYIWSTIGSSPPNLFKVVESTTGQQATTFLNLNFFGGDTAILGLATGHGNRVDMTIQQCSFSGNQVAASAQSEQGAIAQMELIDCTLTDTHILSTPATPPNYQPQEMGFQFWAQGDSGSAGSTTSTTNGRVEELTVAGAFTSMNPQDDYFGLDGRVATTRVIDVRVSGENSAFVQHRAWPSYKPYPIPEVTVDILGGSWEGKADSSSGWGEAIHGSGHGGDDPLLRADYYAGYRINVTGTEISSFFEDGIFCGTSLNARGHLNINGGTSITNTGLGGAPSETRNSGIYIFSEESYMGLTTSGSSVFSKNQGNGIHLKSRGELAGDVMKHKLAAPSGIFLGVFKSKIHENGANGVYLHSPDFDEFRQPSVFIGGTIYQTDEDPPGLGQYPYSIGETGAGFRYLDESPLPNGQGVINRTDISNNGYAGVKFVMEGDAGDSGPSDPDTPPSGIALRLSNDFIWNNPQGGLNGRWLVARNGVHGDQKGYILVPVTHTTMVGNGDATNDFSMEIDDKNGASSFARARYEWTDPVISGSTFYRTNVWNSILQRSSGTFDLGPVLNDAPSNFSVIDDDQGAPPTPFQVAFAGVRGIAFWPGLPGPDENSTQPTIPFNGPIDLFSTDSAQFKLDGSGGQDEIIDSTPKFFHVLAPLTFKDHGGQLRPGETTGLRDKGADEVD